MTGDNGRPLIVVGVGIAGSECSHDALRWAARHAELTGAVLHAVMVWHLPNLRVCPQGLRGGRAQGARPIKEPDPQCKSAGQTGCAARDSNPEPAD